MEAAIQEAKNNDYCKMFGGFTVREYNGTAYYVIRGAIDLRPGKAVANYRWYENTKRWRKI